jgi:hypothetical protein
MFEISADVTFVSTYVWKALDRVEKFPSRAVIDADKVEISDFLAVCV